jgi:hypothetical protein
MSKGVLGAALAETALISWRDLSQTRFLPLPSDYAAVIIIYGGLSFFPESASRFTTAFGWGLVIATWFRLWNPAAPTKLALPGGTSTASTPGTTKPGDTGVTGGVSNAPGPTGHGGRQGSGPQ